MCLTSRGTRYGQDPRMRKQTAHSSRVKICWKSSSSLVRIPSQRSLSSNAAIPGRSPSSGPDAGAMQAIASEIAFSESTFVLEAAGVRYRMRIFTPEREMPFAGHPTLGTAFALASLGRIATPATQVVEAGEFHVEVDVQ